MSSVSAVNSIISSASTSSSSSVSVSSVLAAIAGTSTPGIDVDAAVAAALYAARAPERVWQAQQTTLSNQASALTQIQTATQSLYNDLDSLNSLTGPLASRSVTSSNANAISASAAKGTVTGTHTLTVSNLAATASWYSDLASSATATLPDASFTLSTTSGSSATFTTGGSGSKSLNDLAASINSANLGVKAQVLSDSTGARLSLVSTNSGSAADFSITTPDYTGTSWASPTLAQGQTFGQDSFTITTGGVPTTITTTDGETLAQLADDINGKGLGVTATVVTTSSGSRLQIASNDGATPFTITEPALGFSQAAKGADASFTVDGVPLTSASNSVTTAINGVTLNLNGLASASSPVTLNIAPNASTVSTAIAKLVTDYNTAISQVNSQFGYNGGSSSTGVLASDPTIRSLQSALLGVLNFVHTASPSATGTNIATLSALGISTNQDGTLSLDTDTLSSQIVNNPNGVQDFLMGDSANGFAKGVTSALSHFTQSGNGAFSVDLNGINNTNTAITKQINDYENLYIANQKTLLTAMYSKAEAALQTLPTQLKQIQAQLGNSGNS